MNDELRRDILEEFGHASFRPVRWASEGDPRGDFEDKEATIEIFDVQDTAQMALFSSLRALREKARHRLGRPVRVVFHTPQATTRFYAAVRPAGYRVPLTLVRSPERRSKLELVDDDVLGDSRPPRTKVA